MPLQKIEIEVDVPAGYRVTSTELEMATDDIDLRDDDPVIHGAIDVFIEPTPPTYRTATSSDFGKPVEVCSGSTWYDKAANDADRILIAITNDGTFITRNSVHGGIAEFTDARVRVDSEASNTPAEPEVSNDDPDGVGKGYRLPKSDDVGMSVWVRDREDAEWAPDRLLGINHSRAYPYVGSRYRWRYARVPLTPKAS